VALTWVKEWAGLGLLEIGLVSNLSTFGPAPKYEGSHNAYYVKRGAMSEMFMMSPASVIIRNESVIIRNEIASCNRLREQRTQLHGRLTGLMECCLRTVARYMV